ncbi:MAG: glycosyltransferase family 4 protein [Leptolyngbya sp. Prado105]|jgi:glycosyltransferase involved in cell wall biosynthesis|nr:glycosyltransferase family 4 protein [Leptolyngbya sp. Prado105]
MRIAVIGAKGLPAQQGGIEHHCQELYPRIVQQGHQVDLYARSSYTGSLFRDTVNGVRVISIPSLNLRGLDALSCSLLGTLSTIAGFQEQPYDIIHFHALGPSLFSGLPRFNTKSRVIVTCHGLDWARAKWGRTSRWVLRQGERNALKFADDMIAVSEDLQDYFQATYQRETHYIPNAPASYVVSDPSFQFGQSLGLQPQKYFVFLGRLVPEKRPDLLLEAFSQLDQQGWKLAIVGGDSDSQGYAELLKKQYASEQVVFTGELVGAKLAEIVRGGGLLVLPSDVEGMPLVLLEAMNENVPVLASDIDVHQKLLANGRGLLFEVGQLEACQQQLSWAIEHSKSLSLMAEAAQHYVRTVYNWDDIVQQTLAVYDRALLSHPASSERQREMSRV